MTTEAVRTFNRWVFSTLHSQFSIALSGSYSKLFWSTSKFCLHTTFPNVENIQICASQQIQTDIIHTNLWDAHSTDEISTPFPLSKLDECFSLIAKYWWLNYIYSVRCTLTSTIRVRLSDFLWFHSYIAVHEYITVLRSAYSRINFD